MQQSKGLLRFFRFIVLVLLGFSAGNTLAGELLPFRSDGCSMFPDGRSDGESASRVWVDGHEFSCWNSGTFDHGGGAERRE